MLTYYSVSQLVYCIACSVHHAATNNIFFYQFVHSLISALHFSSIQISTGSSDFRHFPNTYHTYVQLNMWVCGLVTLFPLLVPPSPWMRWMCGSGISQQLKPRQVNIYIYIIYISQTWETPRDVRLVSDLVYRNAPTISRLDIYIYTIPLCRIASNFPKSFNEAQARQHYQNHGCVD